MEGRVTTGVGSGTWAAGAAMNVLVQKEGIMWVGKVGVGVCGVNVVVRMKAVLGFVEA